MTPPPRLFRHLAFVALNAGLVALYCLAMSGRLEPLKHQPTRFVTVPLTVITGIAAAALYPLLARARLRLPRALLIYSGLVLVSALYGLYLWIIFPDGSVFSVLLTVFAGHVYGWPVFLAALVLAYLWPWPVSR